MSWSVVFGASWLPSAVPLTLLAAICAISLPGSARATPLDPESQACQGCHAISDWEINDPVTGRVAHLSIEPEAYAQSSHGSG